MKAITILQPYAHLICLPRDHPEWKGVENREWATSYRGPLAIHAGKSRAFLRPDDEALFPDMTFGAIVGVGVLVECFRLYDCMLLVASVPGRILGRYPWLATHKHIEGTYCFVITDTVRLERPFGFRGMPGMFDVSDELFPKEVLSAIRQKAADARSVTNRDRDRDEGSGSRCREQKS